jgi:glycosyltransferase involved in cell wall biosynthesis
MLLKQHSPLLSVVISARNEFPNIVHTVHSIVNDLETFLSREEWEIIIVDNCSDDDNSWRFLAERGLYYTSNVRVLHDPIAGNVSARDKGAKIAKGKYLFFSDAHMSYKVGSFESMIETIRDTHAIVHPAVQWMGGYEPASPSYQYTLKIGEKLWGTWNNYKPQLQHKSYFYIPVSGHCCLGMLREQYLAFGGYNEFFRCYGGGELYLDLKWWMNGAGVVVDTNALGYHLSAGRGYSYHYDDFIHNIMLMALALNGDALAERIYITFLYKENVNKDTIKRLHDEAWAEAQADRKVARESTLYDVIATRPWDSRNNALHGDSSSAMLVFQDTWLQTLTAEARSYYDNSPLQQELENYISTHLSDSVYGAPRSDA